MLMTTKARLRAKRACADRYNHLCGWAPAGDEAPIPLEDILENNGIEDAIWALRSMDKDGGLAGWFARWCADQVLHLWGAPDVVREYLRTGDASLRVAWYAALHAALAAAGDEADATCVALAAASAISAAASSASMDTVRAAQSECLRSAIARIRAGEPLGGIEC